MKDPKSSNEVTVERTKTVPTKLQSRKGLTDSTRHPHQVPTDVVEPWWDAFDVVEELPGCRFEIPFDAEAAFAGNRNDLYQHAEEMWHKPEQR